MSGECFPRHPVLCRRYHHHHHPPTPHSPHPRSTTTIATTLAVFATLSMLLCCGAGIAALEQSGRDVLDLIPGLNSSHSTTPSHREALAGVRYTKGSDGYAQALLLEEESNRHISLPDAVVAKALRLLQDHKEVTFLCSLRQEIGDSGTVLALSADRSFYLEIESSGRRNEIRFHYSHDGQVRVEMFPYRLADGQWHKMALTLSGGHVSLFIDCNRIYQRVIPPLDLPRTKGTHSLFLGQRNGQQAMFRGALQDVQIVTQAHGFLLQCPQQDTECHTCANFQDMEQRIQEMSTMYRELTHQLSRAEERLSDLEQCECLQYCHDNGTKRRDGEEWMKDKCNICRCKNGSVECHTQECPAAACSKPVYREGQCCPVCLTNCYFSGKYYDHGEVTSPRVCVTCVCQNGRMVCQRRDTEKTCPKLDCPPHERLEIHGQCCPVCNGTDYCAQGHNCHGNASCINLATKLACQCHPGFDGDGHTCQDVDECLVAGGPKGHHCSANTVCVNTPGSYRCDCEKGHSRLDSYECADFDECVDGGHHCDSSAQCVNDQGSYQCQCQDGYIGDGVKCEPGCSGGCQNGGKCISPNICECRHGYIGLTCELDIDECELGISKCHGHSVCINMPGWYQCDCLEGYHSSWPDNHFGSLCQDINECEGEGEGHTCHPSMQCVNTEGGYTCQCKDPESCHKSCIFEGNEYRNGLEWRSRVDECKHCTCEAGRTICHHLPCDCSGPHVDFKCCPSCDTSSKCPHQEINKHFNNGDQWTYRCQTCECLDGEIDCWPMQCPDLKCQNVIHRIGQCCPQCENANLCGALTLETGGQDLSQTSCLYKGETYMHGDSWKLDMDTCVSCSCRAGHICCTFDQFCAKQPGYDMNWYSRS